jgi:catechol 2,3-dioxygenase-like lactoylglutathione lyase family enzyme
MTGCPIRIPIVRKEALVNLYHLGMTVADLRRSSRFYCDVLGFRPATAGSKEILEVKTDTDGLSFLEVKNPEFDQLTGNAGSSIRFVYLQSQDESLTLQLIEYVEGGGEALRLNHNRPGTPHLSFFVDDVEQKRREIEALGDVAITSEIVRITATMRTFYVQDPDGVPVEFLEVESSTK